MAFFGSRILALLPLVVLPIAVASDIGSIALVHLSVPDDADEAARAGVLAIQYKNIATPKVAEVAYEAAASVAELHREQLDKETFTIYRSGAVQVTVSKDAPTLMFKHVPLLRDLTHASVTAVVNRPSY